MGEAETIAKGLTKAQREALLAGRWIQPGGSAAFMVVDFVGPWPNGVAQFFSVHRDRLTPLGLEVRRHLLEGADNAEG